MTKITLRPKGETTDQYDVTGELARDDLRNSNWYLRLHPDSLNWQSFPKHEWEEVPTPFVFPTKRGAVISGRGEGSRLVFMRGGSGNWWSASGNPRTEEGFAKLPDLRVEFEGIDE